MTTNKRSRTRRHLTVAGVLLAIWAAAAYFFYAPTTPLSQAEIDDYVAGVQKLLEKSFVMPEGVGLDPRGLQGAMSDLRSMAERDDGKPIYMVISTRLNSPKAITRGDRDETGHIDVLVANLAAPTNHGVAAVDMDDTSWELMFDMMVHPLHRLCRAVLPQMYQRQSGKIVVFGSATGVKPMEHVSAYSAARAAQIGYVKATGIEAARNNVQINLIAQNFVETPIYFPPEFTATDAFQQLLPQVPIGRLATGWEDASFALFLASNESDFFVGQAIPFSGGWTQ